MSPKGSARGALVLVGLPEIRIAFDERRLGFVVMGGGEPQIRSFENGPELLSDLENILAGPARSPTDDDREFAALMASTDEDRLFTLHAQTVMSVASRQGRSFVAGLDGNDPCICASTKKLKQCCQPRVDAGLAEAKRAPIVW